MTKAKAETDHISEARAAILRAAMVHVPFDGWSADTLALAITDAGVDAGLAAQAVPRGALDLAVAFHMAGDATLAERLRAADLGAMRYSERVGFGVMERLRIAAPNREAVRRGVAFFALPAHAGDGAKCVWNTADTIWTALGDRSDDLNWYSKRAILSGVYSSAALYWLGDTSDDFEATRAFVERRIENVMQFEQIKGRVKTSKAFEAFMAGPGGLAGQFLNRIKAPGRVPPSDLPGSWGSKDR